MHMTNRLFYTVYRDIKPSTQQDTSHRLCWPRFHIHTHTHTYSCRKVADCWYYFSVPEVHLTCPKPRIHILTGSILLYALQPEHTGTSSGGRRFMKPLSPRVNPRHLLPRGFLLKTITSRPAGLRDAPQCQWRDLFVLVIAAVCSR